jgi:stage II sporulation protein D
MAIDDYVARVLAGEGQPAAAPAAQQALAIAARTFVLANRGRHQDEGFDVCDSTHCQVLRPATALTRRVAAATSGQVLLDGGRPASIYYSAWCGGHSELPSAVWPGAVDHSFDRARPDDACAGEPAWTSEIAAADLERALRAAGLKGTQLRGLAVSRRSSSGRAVRLRAEGFDPRDVSAEAFRIALGRTAGWQLLKSTMFEMQRTPQGYRFTGRGAGHGVGICVIGAGARAARGATTEQILDFYYPGLRAARYQTAAPGGDLELALPAADERERVLVADLVRQARDEMAARIGVASPPVIRVTVHPSVAGFGRATGLPWWTAGATDRTSIALLPIAVLKQRGQLERTIRHEVAHVLVDAAMAGRPLWVREGAASYFAGTGSGTKLAAAVCPSDAELKKPPDAAAQRDAYARAEACFARALAAGTPWRDIR